MTKRQPKGTPVGGQFAPDRKPSGGDLTVGTCPRCGGEVRSLPAYNPLNRSNPFPPGLVQVCMSCGEHPDASEGNASDLELAERLNNAHVAWQEFDDGEQLGKSDFDEMYAALDDAMNRLRGDENDPASTNASDLELADQLDDAKHMIRNFNEDGISLSRDDFDYIYGALEGARERLGGGGPHGDTSGDEGYYCATCGTYTDSAEMTCVDCGNEMVDGTPFDRRNEIVEIIRNEFSVPDGSPIAGLPNDRGIELLAHSSFDVKHERLTDDGVELYGVLTAYGTTLIVSNDGKGGGNRYSVPEHSSAMRPGVVDSMKETVLQGFTGLDESNALDVFCSLVSVVQENTP